MRPQIKLGMKIRVIDKKHGVLVFEDDNISRFA